MPELPEVETVRLGLQKYLVGHKIEDVEVRVVKIFVGRKEDIIGAKIVGLKRMGKGLIIELDNDFVLAVHLKMTGQLIYRGPEVSKVPNVSKGKIGGELPGKWTHIIFVLNNGGLLYYNDLRRFGWIKVVKKDKIMQIPFFKEMGPEPPVVPLSGTMDGQAPLNLNKFNDIVNNSNTAIKVLLMDQKKIGGVGNIYANDALFDAQIHPERKAKDLKPEEVKKLYGSILKVLQKSLDYGGSSDENFVNTLGQEGSYQKHTLVYGREKEKCRVCGFKIQKIKLGGRGTYFCPACQK
jgi:formamidopyrimidine-DNA glycosylase